MPASVASLLRVFDVLALNIEGLGVPVLTCIDEQLGSVFGQLLILILAPWTLGLLILACSMCIEVVTKGAKVRHTASQGRPYSRGLPSLLVRPAFKRDRHRHPT